MRYRVDELAARCGLAVDTVRYYQTQGLLPKPQRQGRVAWYDDEHLARLRRILQLKEQGLRLSTIGRLLDTDEDTSDEALVAALTGPLPGEAPGQDRLHTLDELAERTGMPLALLQAVEREGLLVPRWRGSEPRYTQADADALVAGLSLLEAGVPLDELLELARRHDDAMRAIAAGAVDLFIRFVRDPIQGSAASEQEASQRLVTAFRDMLPATTTVVSHHFGRLLLAEARARIERDGDERELAVLRREQGRPPA